MRKRLFIFLLALLLLSACKKVDPNLHVDDNGEPLQGFHTLDGKKHYLRDGYIQSGWITVDGKTYFLNADGVHTGWLIQDGQRYYLNDQGHRQTGWLDLKDGRYLLNADGKLLTGWQAWEEGLYYLAADGKMLTGWQNVDGVQRYFNADGQLHTGWLTTAVGKYYFDAEGAIVHGWLNLEEGTYYMNENGLPVTGSMELDGHQYLFNPDGTAYEGWLEKNGERYYYFPGGKMAIGQVEVDGRNYHFTSKGKYVLLVNYENPVPEDYKATIVSYSGIQVEKETRDQLKKMVQAGNAKGCIFKMNYGYRSFETQQSIWDKRYKAYLNAGYTPEKALAQTAQEVSKPGYSEHQTGMAIDIGNSWKTYNFMADHGWKYGFIIRYPDGKQDFTGITHEPWHVRYVGVELATELHELDMCLEEYMIMLTQKQ